MAYKAGKILTFGGNSNLVQRLQTSGPGSLNIPTERIRETGNELTVSVERDVPDLSFELESLDMSIATEAMFARMDPTAMSDGDIITLGDAQPIHIVAPIKGAGTSKTALRGVAWPDLTLESAQYRFGVSQNATQSFTLRGDSQYGIKGTPYVQEYESRGGVRTITGTTTNGDATVTVTDGEVFEADEGAGIAGTGIPGATTIDSFTSSTEFELSANATADGTVTLTITPASATYAFTNTAIKTVEVGADVYAYGLCVYFADGTYKRLFHGYDYSNTNSGFTLLEPTVAPAGSTLAVVYGSTTSATFAQTIHSTPSVLPGAIRGKHINLYVAQGPSVTITGTTTSGDATVTSSAAFTSDMVGYTVRGTGVPNGTVVGTFTNDSSIELADDNDDPVLATASGTVSLTLTPPLVRWRGVQQVELSWRVQLEYDDELGNIHHVSSDYDVPELTGTFTVKPESADYLFDLWAQVSGADGDDTANLTNDTALEFRVVVKHPSTGAVMKTFRVTDGRVKPPPHQARAGQKVETQFQWESDSGLLEISKGAWAA